ncbi:MAG: 3-hydroxyacyl-CoA dehydrogenase family protein [Vicinamibacteria bacterium]|nr:3-hydroxyacyl-CoA dehydrogenase family protein [Vicinamibacteria bacterium]
MEIKKVGVLGCGLMGSGIAQVCAEAGYTVVVREVSDEVAKKGLGKIEKFLQKGVERGKVTPERMQEVMGRLSGTSKLEDLKDCDLVIEAVIENLELKREAYRTLDAICPAHTIFASNTSSLSITELAAATKRPDRFVGLHFFNPVPLMKLVEVVRSPLTSPEAFDKAYAFATSLGKSPIKAADKGGFIVNRLLVPYLLDAIRALEEGVGSVEDIDKGMQLGCGYPMGPFTLLDFVGLDTTYFIAGIMFEEFHEKRFAAPPLLKRMVQAGLHGRKTGKGFYDYSQEPPKPVAGLV